MKTRHNKTKIIDARWGTRINLLIIKCGACRAIFEHRADKWTVRCPACSKQAGLNELREDWVASASRKEGVETVE
jgi:ribosomal protein S27E